MRRVISTNRKSATFCVDMRVSEKRKSVAFGVALQNCLLSVAYTKLWEMIVLNYMAARDSVINKNASAACLEPSFKNKSISTHPETIFLK